MIRTASPLRRRIAEAAQDESGSTMLLTIFYGVLALALVLVVVSATSLYLERKRLFTLADAAALAAAESWRLEDVRVDGDALVYALDDAEVRAVASAYLADSVHSLRGVELVRAESADARSVTVTLRSTWHAPVHSEFLPLTVPIEVTADARSIFH
ncbi:MULTISPECIES: pilus assembly protein TadG-related protein [unclassified Agromyces]|uniref:pilus assembly protein TadG-related protein n=1 Tax=unclassified Agromyces TaxID=2639701 RepID=UPI0030142C47